MAKSLDMEQISEENFMDEENNTSIWITRNADNAQEYQKEDGSFIDQLSDFIKRKKDVIR